MIIVRGDLHGEFRHLMKDISENYIINSHIFIAGDCGFGFNTIEKDFMDLEDLNTFFHNRNSFLHLIRGNHDNPIIWDLNWSSVNHNRTSDSYGFTNIFFEKDGSFITVDGVKIMCIGGAVSTDRHMRAPNISWWSGEVTPSIEPKDLGIDYVVSHDAPVECPVERDFTWFPKDEVLVKDVYDNRKRLSLVYDKLKPSLKGWYHGHYHNSYTEGIFRGLNIDEMFEVKTCL
jgi:hypothetical protein